MIESIDIRTITFIRKQTAIIIQIASGIFPYSIPCFHFQWYLSFSFRISMQDLFFPIFRNFQPKGNGIGRKIILPAINPEITTVIKIHRIDIPILCPCPEIHVSKAIMHSPSILRKAGFIGCHPLSFRIRCVFPRSDDRTHRFILHLQCIFRSFRKLILCLRLLLFYLCICILYNFRYCTTGQECHKYHCYYKTTYKFFPEHICPLHFSPRSMKKIALRSYRKP